MPLFGVFHPFFQGRPGNTHTLGTYMEAGSVEKGHEFLEPFPLFSYEVCKGNPQIREGEFGCIRGTNAQLSPQFIGFIAR